MTQPGGPDKLYFDKAVDAELPRDNPLASEEPTEEDIDTAQEAADLDQDPEEVPNREQKPEPPRTEQVGLD